MRMSKRDFLAFSGVSAGAVAAGAWSPAAISAPETTLSIASVSNRGQARAEDRSRPMHNRPAG